MFDFFIYIKYLLTGDSNKLEKFKALNKLYKTFKHSKYNFITREKKITNHFLQKMYALQSSINIFKPILDSTLFNIDEKRAQLFLNHFIESNMPEEMRNKKEKFTKETMWKKIIEAENATNVMKSIEGEFNLFKNFLTRKNMPKLESEYLLLYKLNSLASFSFETLFSKFDHGHIAGSQPNYTPIDGDYILNDLKDFYFLISSLPQKTELTSAFNKLYSRNEDSKSLAKKAQHAVNTIYKMIADELSPQIILNLCRFISEDLRLRIPIDQKSFSILDKYRKELGAVFEKNKNFILQKYSEKSQQQEVHSLFKGKHLMKIEGYTDDITKLIEDHNFEPISGIQAIKISKTFILEIYETGIKELLNVLILEAFFAEKSFQTDFSNSFFEANELAKFIAEFEDNINTHGKNSFSFLKTLLTNSNAKSSVGENKIVGQIQIINEKIKNANKKCAMTLFKLGTNIYNIIKDYKSPKPEKINNIKTLKGGQNREFINQLASAYNDIAKYIKIIKTYVSIDT